MARHAIHVHPNGFRWIAPPNSRDTGASIKTPGMLTEEMISESRIAADSRAKDRNLPRWRLRVNSPKLQTEARCAVCCVPEI